ncbi:helicase-related protein [Deinococcus sp. QL22]|uniref:helicase-related protein n=1 Tax=Deinococcus sp. QL22 TaxID=2939437 RepID=UPI0020175FCA|nr:helicase-related protein [Deinococcus sp. QL22]UQN08811.1 DEAD/DEAH box helicase [Deinococcus sp. QL22]
MNLKRGDQVAHREHGVGQVMMVEDTTAVVRFDTVIHEVLLTELNLRRTALQALQLGVVAPAAETQLRVQAELIASLNDAWGVFSRSRIALLPHQLWVCHQVLNTWPPRWLIADDVGLGKTIEAGLILWPLLSRRQVTRLLIIAPAALTAQWQERMKAMFDIRLTIYDPGQDRPNAKAGTTYWDIHQQVIASLQTLRDDRDDKHARLLAADGWDLVLVDEAHHLNVDEVTGATLGYQLLRKLQDAGKINGLVFFTATPHRGKDYGFLSLLHLLRSDLFDPELDLGPQLPRLAQVVIRNNKQLVTDLQGRRLFQPPIVASEEYSYSSEEAEFYAKLTEFIATGQAYAATLGNTSNGQAVMLVLIALQKLASSSVAALRRALRGRQQRVTQQIKNAQAGAAAYQALLEAGDGDALSAAEEALGDWGGGLLLMENERVHLEELLILANRVKVETKIQAVLLALETRFQDRSVLFFTEYKATQSLLLGALTERYGSGSVTFINGDGRAEDVRGQTLTMRRERAAELFNSGEVRFLVATEAAGEGIDLQQHCHTLIHVDLPWNPMRLHQRVGRLNRYGQTKQVEVLSLRNPGTVEARIWDKLNNKINAIMRAFEHVMEEPEDLLQLVLGMTSPKVFQTMFSGAGRVDRQHLDGWFDRQTAQFGGKDVLEVVQNLVGHSASFDYGQVSALIPRVDLPDLLPFFRASLRHNHRLLEQQGNTLSFKTPEAWLEELGVRRSYKQLAFERAAGNDDVAGIGHKVIDAAVAQARQFQGSVAVARWTGLAGALYVYRVSDRVTATPNVRRTLVGRLMGEECRWLRDWELLKLLNEMKPERSGEPQAASALSTLAASVEAEQSKLADFLPELQLNYSAPTIEPYAVFVPHLSSAEG